MNHFSKTICIFSFLQVSLLVRIFHSWIVAQPQFKVTELWDDKWFIQLSQSNFVQHMFAIILASPVSS
jgi:hypothetical protein